MKVGGDIKAARNDNQKKSQSTLSVYFTPSSKCSFL